MLQPERRPIAGSPRSVRAAGITVVALALILGLVIVVGVGGPHGPGRHAPSMDADTVSRWGVSALLSVVLVSVVAALWLCARVTSGVLLGRASGLPSPLPATMGPRRILLTGHIAVSVGLLGAVTGFLALAIAGMTRDPAYPVQAVYLAMEITTQVVILPLAVASLLIGIFQSLASPWGLFRHWWVVAKLILSIFIVVVLLFQIKQISYMAGAAIGTTPADDLGQARLSLVVHAAGGVVLLLIAVALSVFKPKGLTPLGAPGTRGSTPGLLT